MARFLPFLAWFVLSLYATIDCARTPRDRTPGGMARPLWIAVIWLIPILGALAWILVKAAQRAEDGRNFVGGTGRHTPRPARPGAAPRRRGPTAPDDDPDFLAGLAQQRRARLREERRRAKEAQGPSAAASTTDSSATDYSTGGSSAAGAPAPEETAPAEEAPRGNGVVEGDPKGPGIERPDSDPTREERDGPGA